MTSKRIIQLIGATFLAATLVAGCAGPPPSLSNDPGTVVANIIEKEAGNNGGEVEAYELCVEYDARKGQQECLENTPGDVARACLQGERWPDCKPDPGKITKATDDRE